MRKPNCLYYICHIDNLASILKNGIWCRNEVPEHTDIHDIEVLARRKEKKLFNGKESKELYDFVNLYFQPRNAMLYRLICNEKREKFVILSIQPSVLDEVGVWVVNRNAASSLAEFYSSGEGLKKIEAKTFKNEYWTDSNDSKQKMMAEVLVPKKIDPEKIITIYSSKPDSIKINTANFEVVSEKYMFFEPEFRRKIDNISISKGDMFFSNMQTFTISVNTIGVMGKGLASRTKYQFPDAYVQYQDDCKSKKLKIGSPTLYKRGIRIEEELADDPSRLKEKNLNGARWFLFLATKRHWREDSNLADIEKSMQWLMDNYEKEKIQSIALPALGCGLGRLKWSDVGPMMCSYLQKMKIQSCVYLPTEEQINEEYLSAEYLLK